MGFFLFFISAILSYKNIIIYNFHMHSPNYYKNNKNVYLSLSFNKIALANFYLKILDCICF